MCIDREHGAQFVDQPAFGAVADHIGDGIAWRPPARNAGTGVPVGASGLGESIYPVHDLLGTMMRRQMPPGEAMCSGMTEA